MVQELALHHVEVEDASKEVEDREGEEDEERDGPEEKQSCGWESEKFFVRRVGIHGGFTAGLPQQGLAAEREAYAKISCMKSC